MQDVAFKYDLHGPLCFACGNKYNVTSDASILLLESMLAFSLRTSLSAFYAGKYAFVTPFHQGLTLPGNHNYNKQRIQYYNTTSRNPYKPEQKRGTFIDNEGA
jgi:hypothetical protein